MQGGPFGRFQPGVPAFQVVLRGDVSAPASGLRINPVCAGVDMPKISIAPLGVNASMPSDHVNRRLPPRTAIAGWTEGAARRNRRFLMTVDPAQLDGIPLSLTLTVRDVPESGQAWNKLIDSLLKWCRRRGMTRYHWVTEWQERGAPHLHAVVYFDPETLAKHLDRDWGDDGVGEYQTAAQAGAWGFLAQALCIGLPNYWVHSLTAHLGTGGRAQHVVPVDGVVGWFNYLSKHAYRGAKHYQKAGASLPAGWTKTGRLWAKGGDWPCWEDEREVDDKSFHRFRRITWRWQRSKALQRLRMGRQHGNRSQIRSALNELQHLRRSGSFQPRSDELTLILRMMARAKHDRNAVRFSAYRAHLDGITAEKAADHRRLSEVRGISAHMDGALTLRVFQAALDHDTGFERTWLNRADRISQDRRAYLDTKSDAL